MRKKLRILQTKIISPRTESDLDKPANAEISKKKKKKKNRKKRKEKVGY